jgi:hypothetical protein
VKTGDLVRFKSFAKTPFKHDLYIVKNVKKFGMSALVSLYGLPNNQVFKIEQLEVLSESR